RSITGITIAASSPSTCGCSTSRCRRSTDRAPTSRRSGASMRRLTAALVTVLCCASAAAAATPQEQVEARRKTNPKVIVHVISGETLKGSIERAMKDEFYLADEGGLDRILVPYFAV